MPTPSSRLPRPDDLDSNEAAPSLLEEKPGSRQWLAGFSDLTRPGLAAFREYWSGLGSEERASLLASLVELAETSVDVSFDRVFHEALNDDHPQVRRLAIEGLWENESADLVPIFLAMLRTDEDIDVRAEAASALERFTGNLEGAAAEEAIEILLATANDTRENALVRRRCIEAAGPLAGDRRVAQLLREAYAAGDEQLMAGALRAMGLSRQTRWMPEIERAMGSEDAELRFAATTAAGLLGETYLVEPLANRVDDEDAEVRHAAIRALGQIGGPGAVRVLRNLRARAEDAENELVVDALEEAILAVDPLGEQDWGEE
jgi:HEAT repeat protein